MEENNQADSLSEKGVVVFKEFETHEAVFSHSKVLASIDGKPIDAPHCPVQAGNAEHLPHLRLQSGVVAWVHPGQHVDLLRSVELGDEESGIVGGGVVDGGFRDEIGDVVGEVVAAHVVVVDEVHALPREQNIQVVEIIVTQPQRRLSLRQQLLPQRLPLLQQGSHLLE
jgi:hypothetical protein